MANLIEIDRSNLVLMMEAGYIYLGMQRFDEAMKVFEGIAALAPDSDVPEVALGSVEFCKGNFKKAMAHYKKAQKKDPNSLFAKVYMGETLFFSGDKEHAVELLMEVKKADPDGGAGGFAIALLQAIDDGYTPKMLAGMETPRKKK